MSSMLQNLLFKACLGSLVTICAVRVVVEVKLYSLSTYRRFHKFPIDSPVCRRKSRIARK